MKRYISYIVCCLMVMAGSFQVRGQELKSMPGDPEMPLLVTQKAVAQGGSFSLSGIDANNRCLKGTTVTIVLSPSEDYGVASGYPKVYKTGESGTAVTVDDSGNSLTFTMPDHPVTVEVKYVSTAAELTGLSYSVAGGVGSVTVSPLPVAGGSVGIELPWNTSQVAIISFDATCSDGATVSPASVTLQDGKVDAAIVVTAEDKSTVKTYTLKFTTQKQIKEDMVALSSISFVYNGQEQKPAVTVKYNESTTLLGNTDYTLIWTPEGSKNADDYTVTVRPTNKSGGYGGGDIVKTFTITKKPLTVTPDAGQVVYANETDYAPTYTVEGLVEGEENMEFTGSLKVGDEGKIVNKDLSAGDNYTITITEGVVVTKKTEKVEEEVSKPEAGAGSSGPGNDNWLIGTGASVVMKAPDGFLIKETTASETPSAAPVSLKLRDAVEEDGYKTELSFTEEGEHTVYYMLKRNIKDGGEYGPKQATYKLDASLPTFTITPGKGMATVQLADAVSGLASCTYTWDNGGEQEATITSGAKESSFTLKGKAGIHHLTMTVKDVAGNVLSVPSTDVKLEAEGGTTPSDPVYPPSYTYYTVTLPRLVGASTSPGAGSYSYREGSSFRFTLTLEADYSESHPVVTLSDGTILEPDVSGRYTIAGLSSDQVISVSGIEKDTPVANEALSAGAQLTVFRNAFRLQTDRAATLYIFTISGRLDRSIPVTPGETRVGDLPSGIYILRLSSGERWKVIMR